MEERGREIEEGCMNIVGSLSETVTRGLVSFRGL